MRGTTSEDSKSWINTGTAHGIATSPGEANAGGSNGLKSALCSPAVDQLGLVLAIPMRERKLTIIVPVITSFIFSTFLALHKRHTAPSNIEKATVQRGALAPRNTPSKIVPIFDSCAMRVA